MYVHCTFVSWVELGTSAANFRLLLAVSTAEVNMLLSSSYLQFSFANDQSMDTPIEFEFALCSTVTPFQ